MCAVIPEFDVQVLTETACRFPVICKAFRHKLIYSICEIIISVIEVFQWLNITMNVDKVIFSICLVIFQLILNVRVFRMIDL